MKMGVYMYHYELTERGKVAITVLLVILILIVPSAFLVFTAIAKLPAQPPGNNGSDISEHPPPAHAVTAPPVITESPPPNGGGNNSADVPPVGSGGSDTPDVPNVDGGGSDAQDIPPVDGGSDPGGEGTHQPPESGLFGGNPSEGTLSFVFFPSGQNALNEETLSMLDELLNSAKNTKDSKIAIETPPVSDGNKEAVLSTIISALTARGVSERRIEYSMHPGEIEEGPVSVFLYFTQHNFK